MKNDALGSAASSSADDALLNEARKYGTAEEFVKGQGKPDTVRVWFKSKFSDGGAYDDVPVIRKVDGVTLYQGGVGENRQFWTPDKKYAERFGDVAEKTGTFYQIENGNRLTDVYVDAAKASSKLLDLWKKAWGK